MNHSVINEAQLIMTQLESDYLAVLVYGFGVLFWLYLWAKMIGYAVLKEKKLLFIAFAGPIVNFIINIILACYTKILTYDTELNVYLYVERNATTVAGLTLAIAIFVVLRFNANPQSITDSPLTKKFLFLIFWAFLYSVVGCLPLYWVPPVGGALTLLRHIKTVPYTYSLFSLAAAIMIFCYRVKGADE